MNRLPVFAATGLLAGIAVLAFAQQLQPPQPPTPSVIDWIRTHAIPLATVDAGHGFDDLQPLKKIIGDARVVELGEATHGTSEFFRMKHRMLEFLATQMGFTIFSIEANMPEAYRLNDYVLDGKGDPKALIKGMNFWTWDTQEVLAMVEWMRGFNQSGKGHVEFTGFDMQAPNVALQTVFQFLQANDAGYVDAFKDAAKLATAQNAQPGFGVATAEFPLADAAGKRIHYSGYIKTEGITSGYAGLWWRVDGQSGVLAFDNMGTRGVTGTTDWKKYEIDLPVAADAKDIAFGALHPGNGTAWFDGLSVDIDGKPWENDGTLDLDFEFPAPHGFYIGGTGYQVQTDTSVFHSGDQSLRMKFVGAPPPPGADPKAVIAAWEQVVSHMETQRETYLAGKLPAKDVDWAIQNARIVLQAMQLRANPAVRDESMATNIQWILKQNPDAKMVVWAHNGHVQASSPGKDQPMGSWLRKALGNQLVALGFAFNEGSFQAVEQGKGLHDFTVPPAPDGSLDATFASTGIPLFALDLRQIPSPGPVADWFGQLNRTRSIGAVFSDAMAPQFLLPFIAPRSFDAMFFVEKTTAAHPNTPPAKP